jgi:hypothetical protein
MVKLRTLGWALGGLLLGLLLLTSLRLPRLTVQAQSDLAAAIRQRDAVRSQFTAAEKGRQPGVAKSQNAATANALPPESSPTEEPKAKAGPGAGDMVAVEVFTEEQEATEPDLVAAAVPEVRALHLRAFDEEFESKWRLLMQQLQLPPDKATAFKALLRAEEEKRLDIFREAWERKLEVDDPAIQSQLEKNAAARLEGLRTLIGADGVASYEPYRKALDLQARLGELAEKTYLSASPLTPREAQQLLPILAAHSRRDDEGVVLGYSTEWSPVLEEAERKAVFSPTVLAGLRALVVEHEVVGRRVSELGDQMIKKRRAEGAKSEAGDFWLPELPALQWFRLYDTETR